jgi:glycerol uptake facilitator-like aquaporin
MRNQILGYFLKFTVSSLLIVCFASTSAFAQAPRAQGTTEEKASPGPRKHIASIVFAALGGAVLGLSTLSFYGRPQEKLANIAIGAAVGAIAATAYVTYSAATRPAEFYGAQQDRPHIDVLEEALVDRQVASQSKTLPLSTQMTVYSF